MRDPDCTCKYITKYQDTYKKGYNVVREFRINCPIHMRRDISKEIAKRRYRVTDEARRD